MIERVCVCVFKNDALCYQPACFGDPSVEDGNLSKRRSMGVWEEGAHDRGFSGVSQGYRETVRRPCVSSRWLGGPDLKENTCPPDLKKVGGAPNHQRGVGVWDEGAPDNWIQLWFRTASKLKY